jgi:hypothetical protein
MGSFDAASTASKPEARSRLKDAHRAREIQEFLEMRTGRPAKLRPGKASAGSSAHSTRATRARRDHQETPIALVTLKPLPVQKLKFRSR